MKEKKDTDNQSVSFEMVPVVGLEPTRVSPTDFESVTSAIPSHRQEKSVVATLISISKPAGEVKISEANLSQPVEVAVAGEAAGMFKSFVAFERPLLLGDAGQMPAVFDGE